MNPTSLQLLEQYRELFLARYKLIIAFTLGEIPYDEYRILFDYATEQMNAALRDADKQRIAEKEQFQANMRYMDNVLNQHHHN